MSSGAAAADKSRNGVVPTRAECPARSRKLDAPANAVPRNVRREQPGWEFRMGGDSMSERAAKPELSSTLTCPTALPTSCLASKAVNCVSQAALRPSHGQTGSDRTCLILPKRLYHFPRSVSYPIKKRHDMASFVAHLILDDLTEQNQHERLLWRDAKVQFMRADA